MGLALLAALAGCAGAPSRTELTDALVTSGVPADVARAGQSRPPGRLARDAYQAYLDGAATLRPYAEIIGADADALADALENEQEPGLP